MNLKWITAGELQQLYRDKIVFKLVTWPLPNTTEFKFGIQEKVDDPGRTDKRS